MRYAFGLSLLALVHFTAAALPQAGSGESLTHWQWRQQIRLPDEAAKYFALVVPPPVFDQAQPELHDLRIADSKGRTVPYALYVRKPMEEQQPVPFAQFTEGSAAGVSTVGLEFKGDGRPEHNAIQVITAGRNFRRRAELEGKRTDDDKWAAILPGEKNHLVHFDVDGREVRIDTLAYPVSRLPMLRLHVYADPSQEDKEPPKIEKVRLFRQVKLPGESVVHAARLEEREPTRDYLGPASAWMINLSRRVPCSYLLLSVEETGFARPFRIEQIVDEHVHSVLQRGELVRRAGADKAPLRIDFGEVFTRKLRLVVADAANPPLNLTGAKYGAASRELIFPAAADAELPLWLYYGNPNALAPHYDFAEGLPFHPEPTPVRVKLGQRSENPIYQAPATLWSERWPWLIYLVLSLASLALLAMLIILGRETARMKDEG